MDKWSKIVCNARMGMVEIKSEGISMAYSGNKTCYPIKAIKLFYRACIFRLRIDSG